MDFPEFKRWLHSITAEVSEEEQYQFLLNELNSFLASKTNNHIKIENAPELKTWIRDTEEGTQFAVKAFMNKYRSHLNDNGKQVALEKWKSLSDKLSIKNNGFTEKIVESHSNFKELFNRHYKGISKSTSTESLPTFPALINKKLEGLEQLTMLGKIRNLWANLPNKGLVLSIAASLLGGAIITLLLVKHVQNLVHKNVTKIRHQ